MSFHYNPTVRQCCNNTDFWQVFLQPPEQSTVGWWGTYSDRKPVTWFLRWWGYQDTANMSLDPVDVDVWYLGLRKDWLSDVWFYFVFCCYRRRLHILLAADGVTPSADAEHCRQFPRNSLCHPDSHTWSWITLSFPCKCPAFFV